MRVERILALLLCVAGTAAGAPAAPTTEPGTQELTRIRGRIQSLTRKLQEIDRRASDVRTQEERLTVQLELARVRVSELESVLRSSRDQILHLRDEAGRIGKELEDRREMVRRQLQMLALLGKPGPLQLFFDAARGGNLASAMSTVTVLTRGQVRLMQEYGRLRDEHQHRLRDLNAVLVRAQREAADLEARREELERVQSQVARERARLERRRAATSNRLVDLRNREAALERLLNLLASKHRVTGRQDIRRFRGALPWPVEGVIRETFGRHRLKQYATYTVCNGLRLQTAGGTPVKAVFPGVVAYARYFKGYGNMVVVDHGSGVYSLVAGLATILVRRDQNVAMGSRLGLTSPPSEDGNFYLEVRIDGRAVDPRSWLRLSGGSS